MSKIDDLEDYKRLIGEELPSALKLALAARTALHRPEAMTYVPRCFSVAGKTGQLLPVERRDYRSFKVDDFLALDTSERYGHGTIIERCFVGAQSVLPSGGVPTWLFREWLCAEDRAIYENAAKLVGTEFESAKNLRAKNVLRIADAAGKMTWPTLQAALPVTFEIRFLVDCSWQGAMWGWELS